jgi:hypothetical protein
MMEEINQERIGSGGGGRLEGGTRYSPNTTKSSPIFESSLFDVPYLLSFTRRVVDCRCCAATLPG